MVTGPKFPKLFVFVFLAGLIIDQLVKFWVRAAMFEGQTIARPLPGVFELKLTYNEGIAFGMFQGMGQIFSPIAIAIAGACFWWCRKHPEAGKFVHFAVGLLAGGAIGNLIDRVWLGKVTDMFWFRLINFPVFNFADSCITVAVILLLAQSFRESAKEAVPQESAAPATVSADQSLT